tara:strand:+ start:321 stop:677 length:357 start_codon:yes stop_codon:yes gene_type:complete
MEILNKLKKIQSQIETANQNAYDSKQEIENLEYNLSQAGDYADDVSSYLEDVGRDVESLQETLEDDWAILERTVVIKLIIQIVRTLPEIDRDYTVEEVARHFKPKKEETAAEETTKEN